MGWAQRATEHWRRYGTAYPLDFFLGWIAIEETNNAARPTSLGEVGWGQLHPSEVKRLGLDADEIVASEEYSAKALVMLMDEYASHVPEAFTGTARLGMIKLRHALPKEADVVARRMPGASTWGEVSDWIAENVDNEEVRGSDGKFHDAQKWRRNVDKVFAAGALLVKDVPAWIVALYIPLAGIGLPLALTLATVGIILALVIHA